MFASNLSNVAALCDDIPLVTLSNVCIARLLSLCRHNLSHFTSYPPVNHSYQIKRPGVVGATAGTQCLKTVNVFMSW